MKNLVFEEPFECIICLDADIDFDILKGLSNIPILAADGAAIRLIEHDIDFHKVIGDFDTIINEGYFEKIPEENKVILEEQESNDFDKCLKYAQNEGYNNVLILGFHGGLLEHSLNNWSVFMRYSLTMNICIYDKSRYGIPVHESLFFDCFKDEIISLIPQPQVRIKTTGLEWALDNEEIELGLREGARNKSISNSVKLNVIQGSILLFIDSRIPFAPTFI